MISISLTKKKNGAAQSILDTSLRMNDKTYMQNIFAHGQGGLGQLTPMRTLLTRHYFVQKGQGRIHFHYTSYTYMHACMHICMSIHAYD